MRGMGRMLAVVLALAMGLTTSGCYGPFNLTKKVHQWNGQVGGKWANEAVFLLMIWLPVYGIASLGDGLIFNSIEFWGGVNPITPAEGPQVKTRRIARQDAEAVLSRVSGPGGEQFAVEQFLQGQAAGSLRMQQRDGLTVGMNDDGETLFTAQTLADGSIVVSNAAGQRIASHSAEDVARLTRSARQ